MGLSIMDGNEATAWGAYYAGCRFFAGYPLTPATTVYNALLRLLPPVGGTVIQAEDEIAAMGYCIGSSMAGVKTMTATSGPGLSLYSEQLSFAIASEVPLVIVNVQRLGPSTGAATRGADGDIQFMRWGNSGGIPIIALSPTHIGDCFTLAMQAFHLAEKYRTPVFVASNKELGMTEESVDIMALDRPHVQDRIAPPKGESYLPYAPLEGSDVPGFLPFGHDTTLVRQTSSAHAEDGYLSTFPKDIAAMNERLMRKVASKVDEFSFAETHIEPDADTMIVTYGVTARTVRQVYKELLREGKPVSLLILKTLWPVPESLIREKTRDAKRIVVVEMNYGQYVHEIERVVKDKPIEFLGQMDGQLISPVKVKEVVHD